MRDDPRRPSSGWQKFKRRYRVFDVLTDAFAGVGLLFMATVLFKHRPPGPGSDWYVVVPAVGGIVLLWQAVRAFSRPLSPERAVCSS
jgi:hypothetical protein